MPAISAGDKVLVTGGNGYIASWIVRKLLEKDYLVRAVLRSPRKARHLLEYFKPYGDKLEIAYVAEIEKEGAFDEAMRGVNGVIHTASPATLSASSAQAILQPAVDGTTSMMKSALKAGTNLKRVVITSSITAITHYPPPPGLHREDEWNNDAIEHVQANGDASDPTKIYCASKALAEKAAWDLYELNKAQVGWDLAVIQPPITVGPSIQELGSSPGSLNTSMAIWWQRVMVEGPESRVSLGASEPWADVRDMAEGHIAALEKEAAGGKRMLISAGDFVWQEWVDLVNQYAPSILPGKRTFKGQPGQERIYLSKFDTSNSTAIGFSTKYAMEETTKDLLQEFAHRGW